MLISIKYMIFNTERKSYFSFQRDILIKSNKSERLHILKIFLSFILLISIFIFFQSSAHAEIYKDSFSNGKAELKWNFFPHFFLDNISPEKNTESPDGDGWIGVLRNSNAGGFAALSYIVTEEVSNFTLEAWIFCHVTQSDKGQLSGLAFLIDPIGSKFYRFICDFKSEESNLNIAYVGRDTNHFPVYIKFWRDKEIPGGIPKSSGWHKMKIRVKKGNAIFYWNDVQLTGEHDVSRISKGFVGVYANFVGGMGRAETKVDRLILRVD